MLLLIAFMSSICTFAQNVAVTKQLKAKYSIVEYNKSNGGWYLIGKQEGTETLYGFCNKLGKVIAFGGKEYRAYNAFIEFYMPDPALKKAYDEWKKDHDEWKKEYNEYDKLKRQYDAKEDVIFKELYAKEERKTSTGSTSDYLSNYFNKKGVFELMNEAEAIRFAEETMRKELADSFPQGTELVSVQSKVIASDEKKITVECMFECLENIAEQKAYEPELQGETEHDTKIGNSEQP